MYMFLDTLIQGFQIIRNNVNKYFGAIFKLPLPTKNTKLNV